SLPTYEAWLEIKQNLDFKLESITPVLHRF
ncbi:MAG: hypothetical protein ACI9AX_002719, partial [Polaromonas sp.]